MGSSAAHRRRGSGARARMVFAMTLVTAACRPPDPGPDPDVGPETDAVLPFGQAPPGLVPELFAPGVVNGNQIEINGVFTPDGRQFLFARQVDGVFAIFQSDFGEVGWSEPRPLDIYGDGSWDMAVDMAVTMDGGRLYFLGRHEHPGDSGPPDADLWVAQRDGDSWAPALLVPPPVSTERTESYPVVVADGSLYFSSDREGGSGGSDVYRSQLRSDGSFAEPVNLGPPINTEFHEGDTFVAPDESYLILSSERSGGLGGNDLYVSFRQAGGGWSEPAHLGPTINSEHTDFCPMVSPDGKYFFFSRRIGGSWTDATDGEIWWVDAGVIDQFRPVTTD